MIECEAILVTFLTVSTMSPATPRTISQKLFSFHSPSGNQKLISFRHGGYFENGLNFTMSPDANWLKKRSSSDQNSRISGISNNTMDNLSSPQPNAQPILLCKPAKHIYYEWFVQTCDCRDLSQLCLTSCVHQILTNDSTSANL